ncbi:MAG: tetratricopeptide (TPR) repeat protein [Lysobacterales bacterium]
MNQKTKEVVGMLRVKNNLLTGFVVMSVMLFHSAQADAFAFQDRVATAKSLAHYAMGQVYDLVGDAKRATLEYKVASQFDPSSYLIRLRLGVDYARLNMLTEAIEELKLVAVYNTEELQSHYLLALIFTSMKDYDKAAKEYEYILKTFSDNDPKNIEIYGYLGQLYYSQRKYSQAIKQFKKIYELEPENTDVMYLLGSLYVEMNEVQRALNVLNKSIRIDPNHDGSLNTLAYIYAEEESELDLALEYSKLAIKLAPESGAYLDTLGWVYYKRAEYEEARDTLLKADSILKDAVIHDHLGDVYLKLNQLEEAIKYWEKSLELQPDQEKIAHKLNKARNSTAHQQK